MFWTYQSGQRKALDNFEQLPSNTGLNTLGGTVTTTGFVSVSERLFNNSDTDYTGALPAQDTQFFHDTLGLTLGWLNGQGVYVTRLPIGQRDVSAYSHLTFRAAKRPASLGSGPDMTFLVNIRDGAGHTALWDLPSSQFDRIPHPYTNLDAGVVQSQMVGVRIPLRNFTQNNSLVDLTDIVEVTIRTQGTDAAGIDDIEFGL
jgi:hypothetical protein